MNFNPVDTSFGDNSRIDVRCNRPDVGADIGCGGSWSINDGTPFIQELFLDPASGEYYYHIVVGTPGDGFAQDVYVKATGRTWEGGLGSATLGDGDCRSGSSFIFSACNISDPLGLTHDNVFTGNGTGDPKAVVMRQLLGGTWDDATDTWSCTASDVFCMEFLKDDLALKPFISLQVRDLDDDVTITFELDMRNSDFDTDTIAGTLVNRVEFGDAYLNETAGHDYDVDVDPVDSRITGGRYRFTGTGPTDAYLEPYIYWDGHFTLDQDWSAYKP